MGEIILISGEIQSGKTNLCLELYRKGQQSGILVGGVISPAIFTGGEKTAIEVLDLRSGEKKLLAEASSQTRTDLATQHWSFFPEAVAWGNEKLGGSVPCDLLIVDELGPLEFQRGEGWVNGFAAIESGAYKAALVVIRPSLVEEAVRLWQPSRIVDLDQAFLDPALAADLFDSLDLIQNP